MMKNIVLPLLCLLVGGVAGYGLRGARETAPVNAETADSGSAARKKASANVPAAGGAARMSSAGGFSDDGMSLSDRMRDLLVDYDQKSTRKALAQLSEFDLQGALAMTAALPKSTDRD
ncbi:MAG: hypothetical protein JNG86_19135, partial [Verrucomicrobiaceae bacterium]|nr:hypothetical protein [Verrucomicrobiaceae bacterium]